MLPSSKTTLGWCPSNMPSTCYQAWTAIETCMSTSTTYARIHTRAHFFWLSIYEIRYPFSHAVVNIHVFKFSNVHQ